MKKCTGCNKDQPFGEFYKNPKGKFGLQSRCKSCQLIATKKHYAKSEKSIITKANLVKRQELFKNGLKECLQCCQIKSIEGFHNKKQGLNGLNSKCKSCNIENTRIWREENIDKVIAYRKSEKTQEVNRLQRNRWAEKNANKRAEAEQRRRVRKFGNQVIKFNDRDWNDKVKYWSDKCWICKGPWDQMDHVKPISKGGGHLLANLRPICALCNIQKYNNWPITKELIGYIIKYKEL